MALVDCEGGRPLREIRTRIELVYAVHPGPIAAIISGHATMTSTGSDPALLAAAKDPTLVILGGFHEQRFVRDGWLKDGDRNETARG
ncbi:MAG TPA: hypothetical protein VGH22_16080 [Candidatus Binatia bacterium]